MLNPPESYSELGTKAGEARNQRDESRAQFHACHFRKARALESEPDRNLASALYDEAYRTARASHVAALRS